MPLLRGTYKTIEPLRKTLGRTLCIRSWAKTRKKAKVSDEESDSDDDNTPSPTEPSSGFFVPRLIDDTPRPRKSGSVSIPVHGTLEDAEMRLSELYNTKGLPDHARQLALSLLKVVDEEDILAGFSRTVAACAIACVAALAMGKTMLTKAAIEGLGVHPEAVSCAGKLLRAEREKLEDVLEPKEAETKGKGKRKPQSNKLWLQQTNVRQMRAMWDPPGPSPLREVTASGDVSEVEHQEARLALLQAELDRARRRVNVERLDRARRRVNGETLGRRSRMANRSASVSVEAESPNAAESDEAVDGTQQLQTRTLPQRSSSRKEKAS